MEPVRIFDDRYRSKPGQTEPDRTGPAGNRYRFHLCSEVPQLEMCAGPSIFGPAHL